jgi:hypothetical protein
MNFTHSLKVYSKFCRFIPLVDMKIPGLTPLTRYALVFVVILYSCSEPDVKKRPVEPDPEIPTVQCGADVLHGYCDKTSYFPGATVNVFLQGRSEVPSCVLNIYSINEEIVLSVPASVAVQSLNDNEPSMNGFGYAITTAFEIPASMPSGVYTIERNISFVVKPKEAVDVLVVYPSNTANAYAQSGGKSLYYSDRLNAVSFHRPISLQSFCVPCLQWFETLSSWSFGYVADSDLDNYELLSRGKVLAIIGHSEYWTREARLNFDRFIDSGGNALILSGNTMWWQVRYEGEENSKMVCYKSLADPVSDPVLKTYLWNDPSLQFPIVPSIGADFDRGGYGLKSDAGWNGYRVVSSSNPLLEGTGLQDGDTISCPTVEYDGAPVLRFENDKPVLDNEAIGAERVELIGFDKGFRVVETYGTFLVMKRKKTSGLIVNTGSTNWCSADGIGGSSRDVIKKITLNSITKLVNNSPVFSD